MVVRAREKPLEIVVQRDNEERVVLQNNVEKIALLLLAGAGFFAILAVALTVGDEIEGENWIVEELVIEGTPTAPLSGTELSAFFDDGELGGVAGCNSFFGGYETDADSIAVGPIASTMAFCSAPEGIMEQEFAYLALLGEADAFARDGDSLTLSSGGSVLVTFLAGSSG
jgi:heat shock protein HslJ